MSDRLVVETLPNNKQHAKETDKLAPAGFEPEIPPSEQLQTHALDGASTSIGCVLILIYLLQAIYINTNQKPGCYK